MKKFDRFLIRQYLGPLVLTFFIAIFVLLLQFLWKYMDDLVGKGLGFVIVAKFIMYACWTFVPMALPLAVLLSSLMLFGNLGERYELVALKSSGIPLRRAMLPIAIVNVLVCCLAFYFSNNMVPEAYLKYRVLYYEIRTKKPTVNIIPGEYYTQIEGYTIRISGKKDGGNTLENVQIYDHTERKGNTRVTMARTGKMHVTDDEKYLIFDLYDGNTYGENLDERSRQRRENPRDYSPVNPFTRVSFKQQQIVLDISSFQMQQIDKSFYEKHEKSMPASALLMQMDTAKQYESKRIQELVANYNGRNYYLTSYFSNDSLNEVLFVGDSSSLPPISKSLLSSSEAAAQTMISDVSYFGTNVTYLKSRYASYAVEWHRKYAFSFACIVLFLLGAPLGAIIRKGGLGMPMVVAILLFIFYYIISVIGEKSALEGSISSFWGVWISPIIFLPFGVFLTLQATVDADFLQEFGS
ncbi:MAG: LptF/LptG family permease [Bacteroidales bacterium]|jgi:lipopolysaccharide export system permease protein|nr:LptF/LptG family permease [Bacteroidales bacterium]